MKTNVIYSIIIAGVICFLGGYFLRPTPPPPSQTKVPAIVTSLQDAFVATAQSASPAVVVIRTGRNYIRTWGYHGFIPGETPIYHIPQHQGSGFFVTDSGYIVTNNHIVRGQDFFNIKLQNGRSFPAKLAGTDPASDLAVLKIDSKEKFPFLRFAPQGSVKVGHWVLAIGAPFNLAHTVTAGIVSHKKRAVGLNLYENYIQTDASINPGNSGGPLLNLRGEVVGVNDFILSPAGGNIGLSFAIAAPLAESITKQLITHGKVSRPWLGIAMTNLPDQLKSRTGVQNGALITAIQVNSPAALYKLHRHDIILRVNDITVKSSSDVQQEIMKQQPGSAVKLLIYRNGRKIEFNIPTAQAPTFTQLQHGSYRVLNKES